MMKLNNVLNVQLLEKIMFSPEGLVHCNVLSEYFVKFVSFGNVDNQILFENSCRPPDCFKSLKCGPRESNAAIWSSESWLPV